MDQAPPTILDTSTVIELRQYRLHPGKRNALIDLFEQSLVEPQEAAGMRVLGQFRDKNDADRFVWLRGFRDMPSRAEALQSFYGGRPSDRSISDRVRAEQLPRAAGARGRARFRVVRVVSEGRRLRPASRQAPGIQILDRSRATPAREAPQVSRASAPARAHAALARWPRVGDELDGGIYTGEVRSRITAARAIVKSILSHARKLA